MRKVGSSRTTPASASARPMARLPVPGVISTNCSVPSNPW